MAPKSKGDFGNRANRFRMIVIDSDLSDGAIGNLTQAITHALRPAPVPTVAPRVLNAAASTQVITPPNGEEALDSDVPAMELEEGLEEEVSTLSAPKGPRKLPLPTYLHDLDLKGDGPSFKEYAAQQHPTKHAKRFLVAAMWLKEYGKKETVNADMIYTCYKAAGWPTAIKDWDVNFRNHVKADRMRRVRSGEYTITPHGEDQLTKVATD